MSHKRTPGVQSNQLPTYQPAENAQTSKTTQSYTNNHNNQQTRKTKQPTGKVIPQSNQTQDIKKNNNK